mgnify:CR=1 FL=1
MNKELYISDDVIQKIQKFDAIIFDCDGVLVDIRNSYDNAINKTISAIMNELFNDLEYIRAYIDDLLIISSSNFEDHLNQVKIVPKKLPSSWFQNQYRMIVFCQR